LGLLRSFALTLDAEPIPLPVTAERVLAFLALTGPVDRQTAAGQLWPEVTDARAGSSLRTALSKLRHAFPFLIITGGHTLELSSSVYVDVTELRHLAGDVITGSGSAVDAAVGLLHLSGELLPTWDEHWLVLEREQLRQIQLQALECCATTLSKNGQHAPALTLAYEAIRADPSRESAYRVLIAIHLAQGNRVQALRVYRRLAQSLWDDYQVQPSTQLRELLRGSPPPVSTVVPIERFRADN
jgi:DNA-binding SARP family transcriptional activator